MCDCIAKTDAALAPFNTVITTNLLDPTPRALVLTEKLNRGVRGKPRLLMSSYCPFCGEKYGEAA